MGFRKKNFKKKANKAKTDQGPREPKKAFGVLEPSSPDLNEVYGIATCAENLEAVLAKELKSFGVKVLRTGYKAVYFSTSRDVYYRLHRGLGSAGRLQVFIKEVAAGSSRILFDKARRIHWGKWIKAEEPLMIKVKTSVQSKSEVSVSDVGSKIREAIKDHFKYHYDQDVCQSSYGAKVAIVAFLDGKGCSISLETHGQSLHQRGYRAKGHPAPLKENLAFSILKLCGYQGSENLVDLCTGSGTFAIEAAMMAKGIEPNSLRPEGGFGLSALVSYDSKHWKDAHQANVKKIKVLANDRSDEAIAVASTCAKTAGVADLISFACCDMQKLSTDLEPGLVVGNLPYDERLTVSELDTLYTDLSSNLKQNFPGWRVGLLIAEASSWKNLPFKFDQQIKLKNGTIPVRLLVFTVANDSKL